MKNICMYLNYIEALNLCIFPHEIDIYIIVHNDIVCNYVLSKLRFCGLCV